MHDSDLRQLPDITADIADRLQKECNVSKVTDLMSLSQLNEIEKVIIQSKIHHNDRKSNNNSSSNEIKDEQGSRSYKKDQGRLAHDFARAVRELPSFSISLSLFKDGETLQIGPGVPIISLSRDIEYTIDIDLKRTRGSSSYTISNGSNDNNHQTKQKEASWWAVLSLEPKGQGNAVQGSLMGLKRIGKVEQSLRTELRMTIGATAECKQCSLVLRLVCDSLRGCDHKFVLPVEIA